MEEMNNNTETRTEEVERQEETIKEAADKKEIDYNKLEEILGKGIEQKKNAIMNSFFQQMGLSEDEIKEAVSTYKTNKEAAEQERDKRHRKEVCGRTHQHQATQGSNQAKEGSACRRARKDPHCALDGRGEQSCVAWHFPGIQQYGRQNRGKGQEQSLRKRQGKGQRQGEGQRQSQSQRSSLRQRQG